MELDVGIDWEDKHRGAYRPLITAVLQPYYQLESRSASAFDAHPTTRGGAFGVALIVRGALRWPYAEE